MIHREDLASYPWHVVQNSLVGRYDVSGDLSRIAKSLRLRGIYHYVRTSCSQSDGI